MHSLKYDRTFLLEIGFWVKGGESRVSSWPSACVRTVQLASSLARNLKLLRRVKSLLKFSTCHATLLLTFTNTTAPACLISTTLLILGQKSKHFLSGQTNGYSVLSVQTRRSCGSDSRAGGARAPPRLPSGPNRRSRRARHCQYAFCHRAQPGGTVRAVAGVAAGRVCGALSSWFRAARAACAAGVIKVRV